MLIFKQVVWYGRLHTMFLYRMGNFENLSNAPVSSACDKFGRKCYVGSFLCFWSCLLPTFMIDGGEAVPEQAEKQANTNYWHQLFCFLFFLCICLCVVLGLIIQRSCFMLYMLMASYYCFSSSFLIKITFCLLLFFLFFYIMGLFLYLRFLLVITIFLLHLFLPLFSSCYCASTFCWKRQIWELLSYHFSFSLFLSLFVSGFIHIILILSLLCCSYPLLGMWHFSFFFFFLLHILFWLCLFLFRCFGFLLLVFFFLFFCFSFFFFFFLQNALQLQENHLWGVFAETKRQDKRKAQGAYSSSFLFLFFYFLLPSACCWSVS